MEEGLHIKLVNDKSGKSRFDASFGSLTLPKAEVFKIRVKEYDEAYQQKQKKFDEHLTLSETKWKERIKEGWTREKLEENWKANEKERKEADKNQQAELEKKFSQVCWVWTVVPKKITPSELSHNDSFKQGIKEKGEYSIKFPKILEGGGMAYLEAYYPETGAKGAKPFGIFVQATGVPKIVYVEWTDFNYNSLKDRVVGFNSEVLLHIYTEGLYGQELEIKLFDEDTFRDDELNIAEKSAFQREVNIHKAHSKECNKPGITDSLVKTDQDKTDIVLETEKYLQKITLEVKVDYGWMKLAGETLKIYPTVKSLKTGTFFEDFSREYLQVGMNGTIYDVQKELSNMPVLQSEIETNVAAYHPCQYSSIDYIDDKAEVVNIFTREEGVGQNANLEVGIIAGSIPKKFSLKVDDDADTKECRFDGKPNDHEKNIFVLDRTKLPPNIKITGHGQKKIDGEASFDFDLTDLTKYFWLSKDNKNAISTLKVQAATCRYQHHLQIFVVPEITWAVNFFYNTPDPVWYGQSSPTYDIYGTQRTSVRDNTTIGDIRNSGNRVALADLRREENTSNKNVAGGKTKIGTAANRYFGDTKSNFGLTVKATYDGGKMQELSFKFAEKYRSLLAGLKSIYDLADKIAGAKDAREASTTLPPSLAGRRNMMSLSLLPPAPSVGVEWKYALENKTVGIELAGKVKIIPLIGGELRIDVLALADKIPLYGKLITLLDLTTWLAEKVSFNKLSINYRIDLTFYASLALEEMFVKWSEALPKGKRLDADIKFSGTFGGKLEISTDVKAKVKTDVEFTFEAGIKGDCYFKITASPNANSDNMIDWTTKFSGLIITGYYKMGVMNKRDKSSRPSEGSFDPFTLIPAYTGTPLSMKFGEGKENKY